MSPHRFSARAPLVLLCILCASMILQAQESEPNDSCQQAQQFGTPDVPFTLHAGLDPLSEGYDIDFFRFQMEAGQEVIVHLEGQSTNQGTLDTPFLAVLDSSCSVLQFNSHGGLNQSARLRFAVPADGEFIIAASACCDYDLQGVGTGTYRLRLDRFRAAGSVTARLVDSRTGQPVPGLSAIFTNATLLRCNDDGFSSFVNSVIPGSDGSITFSNAIFGEPLQAGTHFIYVQAFGYEDHQTPTFELGEGEHLDLGDIQLTPLAVVGTLSGRVIDALGGFPLPGDSPPFSVVQVQRCEDFGCFTIFDLIPDSQGRFQVNGSQDPFRFTPGVYRLLASAVQYLPSETAQLEIGQYEDVDFADVLVNPAPIQILDVQACANPPDQGESCRFSALLRNGSRQRFAGQAWSLVYSESFSGPAVSTHFQVGRNGSANPAPLNLNIKPGEGRLADFEFEVPSSLPDFARFCPEILVGQDPFPQLNPITSRSLFCVFKEPQGFMVLSEKESRNRVMEHQQGSKAGKD